MIKDFVNILIKYEIDFSSYLIIQDIYYGESIFENYFLANQLKPARTNIERGTLSNIYVLLSMNLILKPKEINVDVIIDKPLNYYYKNFKLTDKAIKIIHEIEKIINSHNRTKTSIKQAVLETNIEDWIDDYRKIWTNNNKMLKANAMGNKQICIEKMNAFISNYPQYNKEIILQAARKYVNDFMIEHAGDTTYLVTAPYFIKRERDVTGNKVESNTMRLEDYCQMILNENTYINNELPSYEQGELA